MLQRGRGLDLDDEALGAELTLDAIAVGEGGGETIDRGGHFPAFAVITFSSLNQF